MANPFSNLQIKDSVSDWQNLSSSTTPNLQRGIIRVRGNCASPWQPSATSFREWDTIDTGSGTTESLGQTVPAFSDPGGVTGTANFQQIWYGEPNDNVPGGVSYRYDVLFQAWNPETNAFSDALVFAVSLGQGAPAPSNGTFTPKTTQGAPARPEPLTPADCFPPRSGFSVTFPHDHSLACYSARDGILAFGSTNHCVRLSAALIPKTGPLYPGKIVQMKPPWWIIQFPQIVKPINDVLFRGPTGEVTLLVQDLVCHPHPHHKTTAQPDKNVAVNFAITGACTW